MAKVLFNLPSITEEDMNNEAAIRKVMSYLYQLNEQLRYQLTHIDDQNISPEGLTEESLSQDVRLAMRSGNNSATVSVTPEMLRVRLQKLQSETEELYAQLRATVEVIELAVGSERVGEEGVGVLRNSSIMIDSEGIAMKAGTIAMEAEAALTLKTESDDQATVNGGRIWHGKNMVLSTAEPANPTTGMVWIEPQLIDTKTGTWSNSGLAGRPWQSQVDINCTGVALGETISTSCRYTVSVPIYHTENNTEYYSVRVWLLPYGYASKDDGIYMGSRQFTKHGTFVASANSPLWLGNDNRMVIHVETSSPNYITVNSYTTSSVVAVAEGSGGTYGWKNCEVHWYAGDQTYTADLLLYKRTVEMPTAPTDCVYNVKTNQYVSGLDGWSNMIPEGTDLLWSIEATVTGTGDTTVTGWSEPKSKTDVDVVITWNVRNSDYHYGIGTNKVIPKGTLTTIGTVANTDAQEASGDTYYYSIKLPLYWQANSSAIERLYVVIAGTVNGEERSIKFGEQSYTAGRKNIWYEQTTTRSFWLGAAENIQIRVYWTKSETGNYLYAWQNSQAASWDTATITMSNHEE